MRPRIVERWHQQISAEVYGLFRIGLGALMTWEAASWLPYTRELFSTDGIHVPQLPIFALWTPSPPVALLLCAILFLTGFIFTLGLWTKRAGGLFLALWCYFHSLDSINEKAVTTISIVTLSVLLLSPCALNFSLDTRRKTGSFAGPKTKVCNWPLRVLQLELAQIYFFCALTKMVSHGWTSGQDFQGALMSRFATSFGLWLSAALPPIGIHIGGLGTIFYELFAPFLLFSPYARRFMIPIGICFHLGIQACLAVGFLGPHFVLMLALVFPAPATVARWSRALFAGKDTETDRESGISTKAA